VNYIQDNVYNEGQSHQLATSANVLEETTTYAYNGNGTIDTVTHPSGLVSTYGYDGNGFLSSIRDGSFRTNSFTYTNGLVYSHTDERGLVVTNVYDALNRLIKRIYPDGTYVSNRYDKLDLVETIDRMGFSTTY
jgi:YD repeat-containing protein